MFCAYPQGEIQLTALLCPCLPASFSAALVGGAPGITHTNTPPCDTESQKGEYAPRFRTTPGVPAPIQLRGALDVLILPDIFSVVPASFSSQQEQGGECLCWS